MTASAREFNAAVGLELRGEIARGGSSIAGMARDIGIARSGLDNYVTGKRSIPLPVLYDVCMELGIEPHFVLARTLERLRAADAPGGAVIPLRRTTDVGGPREDEAEVAFDAGQPHTVDTDDLYE